MDATQILKELERRGDKGGDSCVRIGELKKIARETGTDEALAEDLFATGNQSAMYLAGIIADPGEIRPAVLKRWARSSEFQLVSEYSVAGVAADSSHGWKLGREWVDSARDNVAASGWCTLSGVVSTRPDEELDLEELEALLARVETTIHEAPNRVRYTMNGFVIAVGCYVSGLRDRAREVAEAVGKVQVEMKGPGCKVPFAPDYIEKVVEMGRLGRKRKTARC